MISKEKIKKAKPVTVHPSRRSFVSGGLIQNFLDVKYYFAEESGSLYATVIFGPIAQGPPNHAHGGAIAAVLDEAMGAAAWMNRLHSMTAQLKINYYKAVGLNKEMFIEANIKKIDGKKVTLAGSIFDAEGEIYASTESLFIKQGKDKFKQMGDMPDDLFTYGFDQNKKSSL